MSQSASPKLVVLPRSLYLGGLRILIALSLLVFFPLIFKLPLPDLSITPESIAWLFLITAGLRIIYLVYSDKPRLFDLVFWIFVYIFFGVAAVSEIASNQYPLYNVLSTYTGGYPRSEVMSTQLRIAVGIAAYCGGLWLWNRLSGGRKTTVRWDRLVVSPGRTQFLAVTATLVASALIVKSGPASFFTSRYTRSHALFGVATGAQGGHLYALSSHLGGSLQSVALTVPPFAALAYVIVSGLWRRHKILLVALICVNIITNNPISNARAWVAVVVVGMLAAFMDLSKRGRHVYVACGILISLLLSLSYLSVFKSSYAARQPVTPISQELVQSPDYAMFQQEIDGTIYIQNQGFTSGRQILGSVFEYVPHSLWKTKPGGTGFLVSEPEGLAGNWSSSLWTEFYIDWGYPELVIGFAILGYLFSHLDDIFRRSTSRSVKLIMPVLATYSVLVIRGSLQSSLGYGIPVVLILFLFLTRAPIRSERNEMSSLTNDRLDDE